MTPLRRFIVIAIATAGTGIALGCAPITVTSSTERAVQMARYRTYGWGTVDRGVPGDPRLDNNPFFHDYLQDAIDRQLRRRGYEETVMVPDMRVHYHASATQRIYISGTEPTKERCRDCAAQVYDEGTLLIDLVDGSTGALVWRGSAQTDIARSVDNQSQMEQVLERAVTRILDTLPPGGAAAGR